MKNRWDKQLKGRAHPARVIAALALSILAMVGAFYAWSDAHFSYVRARDPRKAHSMRPTDGAALGKFFDHELARSPDSVGSIIDLRTVRHALAGDPLERVLLRAVGVIETANGKVRRADRALTLSNSLSRRDALTQLGMIERSVQRDDMKTAVAHYHAALSVHPELGNALYPILTRALSFAEVRQALTPYIERPTAWSGAFLGYAVANGNAADIALLLEPISGRLRGDMLDVITPRLIDAFVQGGDIDGARNYAQVVLHIPKASLASAVVNEQTTDRALGPLAWSMTEEGPIQVSANGKGGFDVQVASMARGVVASRTIPVVGGRTYLFSQQTRDASDSSAEFRWEASCINKGKKIVWRQTMPRTASTQAHRFSIDVPASCPGLEFILTAIGPEDQGTAETSFESLKLAISS